MPTNSDSSIRTPEADLVEIARTLAPLLNHNVEKHRRAIAVKWLAELHKVLKRWNDQLIKHLRTYPGFKNSVDAAAYKHFFKGLATSQAELTERDESTLQRLCRPIIRLRKQFPTNFHWLDEQDPDTYEEVYALVLGAYESESETIEMASHFIFLVHGLDIPELEAYQYDENGLCDEFILGDEFIKTHIKYREIICQRIKDYEQQSAASIFELRRISDEADLHLMPIEEADVSRNPGFTDPRTIVNQFSSTPQKEHKTLYTFLGFSFGVVFLIAMLAIAIIIPNPAPFQVRTFTTVMALAAAGAATVMTGLINTEIKLGTQLVIGATGALAVFVIVYMVNPAVLQQ
jgi:hypothetical protein